jgi:hypothetical protein
MYGHCKTDGKQQSDGVNVDQTFFSSNLVGPGPKERVEEERGKGIAGIPRNVSLPVAAFWLPSFFQPIQSVTL